MRPMSLGLIAALVSCGLAAGGAAIASSAPPAPSTPAAQAGLRIGDILETYDRIGVDDAPGVNDLVAELKAAARKGPIAAKIRRFESDGSWRSTGAETGEKTALEGAREVVLPVPR